MDPTIFVDVNLDRGFWRLLQRKELILLLMKVFPKFRHSSYVPFNSLLLLLWWFGSRDLTFSVCGTTIALSCATTVSFDSWHVLSKLQSTPFFQSRCAIHHIPFRAFNT